MTREELEDIRNLKYELHKLKLKLRELISRSPVTSPVPSSAHGLRISDKTAENAQRKIELEQDIIEKNQRLRELMSFINSITDNTVREIVYCKCVQGFGFGEISRIVGLPRETVKKKYYRFFQNSLSTS